MLCFTTMFLLRRGYSCYARATITLINFVNNKDNHSRGKKWCIDVSIIYNIIIMWHDCTSVKNIYTSVFSIDISHWYYSKENDWGYGNFMAWQVCNYIIIIIMYNDCVLIKVCILLECLIPMYISYSVLFGVYLGCTRF